MQEIAHGEWRESVEVRDAAGLARPRPRPVRRKHLTDVLRLVGVRNGVQRLTVHTIISKHC